MAENKLFLVLPIADANAMVEERAYLKVLNAATEPQEFEGVLRRVVTAFSWVKGEEYVLYYDQVKLRDLYKKCPLEVQNQRPSPVQLLSDLCHMTKIPDNMPRITANHVPFESGVLCGYVNLGGEALVDHGGLLDKNHIETQDEKGNSVKFVIIDCTREDVFRWFVENRHPKRAIDPNYLKHGKKEKGEDKEVISARSYSDEEYRSMLQWAVGEPGRRKKYYMDSEKRRLVIFWNENLLVPTYHYYDVDIDDAFEKAKLLKDCGRPLVEQIEQASALNRQ